jgi:hypothetical protein
VPGTQELEQLLRGSSFLWRARRGARRKWWLPARRDSALWRRIDEISLVEYLNEHGATVSARKEEVASRIRRGGGRVRFVPAGPPIRRWRWRVTRGIQRAARKPGAIAGDAGTTIYEAPLRFFLDDFDQLPRNNTLRTRISSGWEKRPRGIRLSFPPELRGLRWLDVGVVGALVAALVLFMIGPSSGRPYCEQHSVWCGAAGSVVAATALGVLGLLLFFIHAHRAIKHYLRDPGEFRPYSAPGRPDRIPPPADSEHLEELRTGIKEVLDAIGVAAWSRRVARTPRGRAGSNSQPPAPVRLIVGRPGAGKTTLLQALSRQLAQAGFVPVAIDPTGLKGNGQLATLARQALKEWLDTRAISQKESERTLQWIAQSGKLVIIADDLHRLAEVGHPELARVILNATRQHCAVLATARRGAVPVGLEQWVMDIEELQPMAIGEATNTAIRLAAAQWQKMIDEGLTPQWPNSPRKMLEDVISRGDLHQNRFFTARVLPHLICTDGTSRLTMLAASSKLASGDLRARLLDAYVDSFLNGELHPGHMPRNRTPDEIRAGQKASEDRHRLVQTLESACLAALSRQQDATVDRAAPGADQAMRAGLLRPVDRQRATVEHAILQSYLASRCLVARRAGRDLIRFAGSAEADDAILFYAGRQDRQGEARLICDRLHGEIGMPGRRDQRMRIAITSADVACRAQIDATTSLAAIAGCWEAAGPLERCEAIERVARMATPEAIMFLWDNSQDADYRVRWAVARGITDNPVPGGTLYATLGGSIAEAFTAAERLMTRKGEVDDWEPEILRLKMLAWTLPALELGSQDAAERERLVDDINHLLWLVDGHEHGTHEKTPGFEGITNQLGLEASVAQGFRAAARLAARPRLADRPLDHSWVETLARLHERLDSLRNTSAFWYSKLLLLHGLAELRIASEARDRPDGAWPPNGRISTFAEAGHPLLQRTAHLCEEAVNKAQKLAARAPGWNSQLSNDERAALLERLWALCDEYIWDDEGVAVRAVSTRLRRTALLLLGEVTILLNLNEKGSVSARKQLARRSDLPLCLTGGPEGRWRMLGEDPRGRPFTCPGPPECAFNLCPYEDPIARQPNALRPLSRAFCLQLQRSAVSSLDPRVRRSATRSQFWAEMADRYTD